jgi:hypothetical protein
MRIFSQLETLSAMICRIFQCFDTRIQWNVKPRGAISDSQDWTTLAYARCIHPVAALGFLCLVEDRLHTCCEYVVAETLGLARSDTTIRYDLQNSGLWQLYLSFIYQQWPCFVQNHLIDPTAINYDSLNKLALLPLFLDVISWTSLLNVETWYYDHTIVNTPSYSLVFEVKLFKTF